MPVPNVRSPMVDKLQFITVTGVIYNLHNPPKRAVTSVEGYGMPSSSINTTSGPYQHGESVLSYRLDPREVSVSIRHNNCSMSNKWTDRDTLLDRLGLQQTDPNNPVEGTLRRIYYVNGVKKVRDLKVLLTEGLRFNAPPVDRWDQWSITEQLTFTANNPILYDPTQITTTISPTSSTLQFPFTFPFVLGAKYGSSIINYIGSWYEYPTIEIDGPTTDITIWNVTTDKYIRYLGSIPGGNTVTIDLTYAAKTVTGSYDENLLGNIIESDLGTFNLSHSPIVSNGYNTIVVYATDAVDTLTSVRIKYYTRYIGI